MFRLKPPKPEAERAVPKLRQMAAATAERRRTKGQTVAAMNRKPEDSFPAGLSQARPPSLGWGQQ